MTLHHLSGSVGSPGEAGFWQGIAVLDLRSAVPAAAWSAAIPRIALAYDWRRQWHYYRRVLPHCQLIVTDAAGAEHLRREGIGPALIGHPLGDVSSAGRPPLPPEGRPIDILFVGHTHSALYRQRRPWLARLARLSSRWAVRLQSPSQPESVLDALQRSRIFWQHGSDADSTRLAWQAIAAGGLLFRQAEPAPLLPELRDGRECVDYDADNLEQLLDHYLKHEDERGRLAQAAWQLLQDAGTRSFWPRLRAALE